MSSRAAIACALLCLSFLPTTTRADVYGFVDQSGATHFATEALDGRYQLFFREGEHADHRAMRNASDAEHALSQTRLFQRVVVQPNVQKFASLITTVANEEGEDPALLESVIAVESAFQPDAVSNKGAVGLMQVLPETAARYGVSADRHRSVAQKLSEPATNVRIGARYLKDLRASFGDLPLALAAYNAGENAVRRFNNQIPPFPETVSYVKVVQQFLAFYQPSRGYNPGQGRTHVTLPARRNMPASVTGEDAPLLAPGAVSAVPSDPSLP